MTSTDDAPPTDDTAAPVKYGTFTNRMLAASIDLGLVMLVAAPFSEWIVEKLYAPVDLMGLAQSPDPWRFIWESNLFGQAFVENALQVPFIAAYTIPFWLRYSTTPGKMLFRLAILDAATGERMGRRQCLRRFFGYIISATPLTLGFLWILFDKKRRGWHDRIAGTVVVVKPKKPKSGVS